MIDRRRFIGLSAGAGAWLALTPALLRAGRTPGGKLIERAIPSSGEMLPVVSFSPQQESDDAGLKEILEALLDNGGKVVDVLHGGAEQGARTAADELGIQDRFFWTAPFGVLAQGPRLPGAIPKVDPAVVRAGLEEKLAKLEVPKLDLLMVSALADVPTHLAVFREMKKEGRVRYIGVHALDGSASGTLESIMRNEPIDFVGTDYSVVDRSAEERILPLAQERRIAFMAYFPFDRGTGLERASSLPLPEWAAEFDAKTWAQFFLKYVISHPAVIVARTGTTKVHHMLDNLGGGIGRLPDEAMRKRMAQLADTFPPPPPPPPPPPGVWTEDQSRQIRADEAATGIELPAAILDRYVGEYRHEAVGTLVDVRRDGDKLLLKVQTSTFEEAHLIGRSETRFVFWPYAIEFKLDGQGRVTGATWEAFQDRIPLVRM